MLRLPRLTATGAIVDASGRPTSAYQLWWEQFARAIEQSFADIVAVNERQDELLERLIGVAEDLSRALDAVRKAQATADAARASAEDAGASASNAQGTANAASGATASLEQRVAALEAQGSEGGG